MKRLFLSATLVCLLHCVVRPEDVAIRTSVKVNALFRPLYGQR